MIDKYNNAFIESLGVEANVINDELKYNEIDEWDSIGHMTLVAALEEAFNITFETDDIIDFSSYKKGKEILSKYGIKDL